MRGSAASGPNGSSDPGRAGDLDEHRSYRARADRPSLIRTVERIANAGVRLTEASSWSAPVCPLRSAGDDEAADAQGASAVQLGTDLRLRRLARHRRQQAPVLTLAAPRLRRLGSLPGRRRPEAPPLGPGLGDRDGVGLDHVTDLGHRLLTWRAAATTATRRRSIARGHEDTEGEERRPTVSRRGSTQCLGFRFRRGEGRITTVAGGRCEGRGRRRRSSDRRACVPRAA